MRRRSLEDDSNASSSEIKDMNFGYAYALFQLEMRPCYYLYRRNQELPSLMPVEQCKRVCQYAFGVLPLVTRMM